MLVWVARVLGGEGELELVVSTAELESKMWLARVSIGFAFYKYVLDLPHY
jgi:hypothetical protein